MPTFANRYPQNAAGKYYVDDQCLDCDLCRETAPNVFRRNDAGGHAYVHSQPATKEDVALCEEMVEAFPMEAIGNDGDQPHPPQPPSKPWWRFW